MAYTLHISKNIIKTLQIHADDKYPQEAVALLFGTISKTDVFTTRVELVENDSPHNLTSFSIDPEIQYSLLMDADIRGESMVGIFHSHPAPPRPSQSDMKNMQLNPVVWLIASNTTGEWVTRAYILENKSPVEVSIVDSI